MNKNSATWTEVARTASPILCDARDKEHMRLQPNQSLPRQQRGQRYGVIRLPSSEKICAQSHLSQAAALLSKHLLEKSWCGSQSSTSCLRLSVAELLIEALCRSANVTVLSFVRTAFKIQLVRCDRALPIKTSSGLTDIEQTSDHGYFRHRHQRMFFFLTVAVVM